MTHFTAAEWVLVITALGLAVKSWIDSWGTGRKLDKVETKLDANTIVTAKVEAHVNSKETGYLGKIETLEKENALLREMGAEKKQTAALLAQAVAQGITTTAPIPVSVVDRLAMKGDTAP
jgi:hypothetical protein